MRLVIYQGARLWSAAETYAELGLGNGATLEQVTSRLAERGIVTASPIVQLHTAIVVRLPAAQARTFTESQGLTLEAHIAQIRAELDRTTAELGRERAAHDETRRQLRAVRREGTWLDGVSGGAGRQAS